MLGLVSKSKFKTTYKSNIESGKIILVRNNQVGGKRERSRSKEKNKRNRSKVPNQSEDKWIKMSSTMADEERTKFLKLMGVKNLDAVQNEDLIEASKTSQKYKKINKNLEQNFNRSQKEFSSRLKKKTGLGFKK